MKFWVFYRDALLFTAYNFFHNRVWKQTCDIFCDLTDFFFQLTNPGDTILNPLLIYLTDFKLMTSHANNHTLFFQLYVILECLGSQTLKNNIKLKKKCVIISMGGHEFKVSKINEERVENSISWVCQLEKEIS